MVNPSHHIINVSCFNVSKCCNLSILATSVNTSALLVQFVSILLVLCQLLDLIQESYYNHRSALHIFAWLANLNPVVTHSRYECQ